MHQRYFTLDEAQELLPQIRPLLEEVKELKRRVDARISTWRHNPSFSIADEALARGQVEFLMGEINARLESVCQHGCLPKDLDMGLVDFPSRRPDGTEIYLCWRLGEADISHWHRVTEGFSARRPIPSPVPFFRSL
ncbi:MAG: DUF2203 domain-containing protein [Elusimicrobia bacterium]|nr:DUF2203 domain-containing protein [Elusimicrobiota bacterium]